MQRAGCASQLLNLVFCAAFLFLLCDFVRVHFSHSSSGRSSLRTSYLPALGSRAKQPPNDRSLRFEVCNGFANQRLSLVYGVVLAAMTNRTVILPDMIPSGVQYTADDILAKGANSYSFESVYDVQYFVKSTLKTGLEFQSISAVNAGNKFVSVSLDGIYDAAQLLQDVYDQEPQVAISCPLFKVPVKDMLQHEALIWKLLDSLRPSPTLLPHVNTAISRLASLTNIGEYNFLHLRTERDWVAHCKRWSSIADGVVRDNCMNNTDTVDAVLTAKKVNTKLPLYVASFWVDVEEEVSSNIFARLKRAGYRVYTQKDLLPNMHKLPRETVALVEFYLGLQSQRFVGNSVSSFTAMIIFERRHAGLWAAYYNGGDVPLAQMLPLDKLPWVFTYNSWSASYDYMLKGAVQSALRHGSLKPYCLFNGDTNSDIFHYLHSKDVIMMQHTPVWADQLWEKAQPFKQENVRHSHLYNSKSSLVGTFQRVDIPLLPELDQYDYVFFSDSDVFFTTRFTLVDFGTPLPRSLGMTYEMVDMFPFNAGVMLMNLNKLRETYTEFIKFILSNDQGMYFGSYGPGDQGAYNQFYEETVKAGKMSQDFNAKPYHELRQDATIVHFHGPKPHHYLEYAETGKCKFFNLCKDGFKHALCTYIDDWYQSARDIPEARSLYRVCKVVQLYDPLDNRDANAMASYDFAAFYRA